MKTECLGKTERKQRARNEKEMIIKEKVFLEKSKNIERRESHENVSIFVDLEMAMREFLSQKREQTQREREHRKSLVFKKMFIKKRKIQKRNIIFDKARINC